MSERRDAEVKWAQQRVKDCFKEIEPLVGKDIAASILKTESYKRLPVGTCGKPKTDYCCEMRRRFVLGIVAENATIKTTDILDFMDFDNVAADGRPVLRIRWCPFCGLPVGPGPTRVA